MPQSPQANSQPKPTQWLPGEHLAVIGTTGTGKTYLMSQLVKLRKFVVVLITKPTDGIKWGPEFVKARDVKALDDWRNEKILLKPDFKDQPKVAHDLIWKIWKQRGWTLVIDEAFYAQQQLGLQDDLEMIYTQGRSAGISVMSGIQRPVGVTRFLISEAHHVISFRVEGRDLLTVKLSTNPGMAEAIGNLHQYDFAHYYTKSRDRNGVPIIRTGNAKRLDRVFSFPSE